MRHDLELVARTLRAIAADLERAAIRFDVLADMTIDSDTVESVVSLANLIAETKDSAWSGIGADIANSAVE